MPTYLYRCSACGHEFEKFQRISDTPLRICPACEQEQVQRVLTGGSGLIFKGSGFYSTDYKKSAPKETPVKTEKKEEKKAESTS